MAQMKRSEVTRQRLLEAAVEVFAQEGFRGATIHQICGQAGANISAAHYHFGDKEGLYAAVFEYAERRSAEEWPLREPPPGTPEERLRAHVTAFLTRLLDPRRPAWMARLLARELIEPTPALDRLVRRRMRTNHDQLAGIIGDLLGPDAEPQAVRLCTLSVIAQCAFYRNSAPIVERLYPEIVPERDIARLADHITRYSLLAMRGLAAERRSPPAAARTRRRARVAQS
jgi:TetR/AcrR family transcriptional regulator, regulator of cefoperazone and chloramphenicol sensitivity